MKIFNPSKTVFLVAIATLAIGIGDARGDSSSTNDAAAQKKLSRCKTSAQTSADTETQILKSAAGLSAGDLANRQSIVSSTLSTAMQRCTEKYLNGDFDSKTNTDSDTSVSVSGDCGHAKQFTGADTPGQMKGDNCQVAADAVQNIKTREQATQLAAISSTQVATMIASNQAANDSSNTSAQNAQKTMLQVTAITKLAQAAEEAYSASQLNSAADGASLANKRLKAEATNIQPICSPSSENLGADKACLDALNRASNGNVSASNYKYVGTAATEAKTQADAASNAATTETMSAVTNGLVGAITWMQSKEAAQNANLAPALSYGIGGSMVTGSGPLVGATMTNPATGTNASDTPLLPSTGLGGIQSGMAPNQNPLTTPKGTIAASSPVSGSPTSGGVGGGDAAAKNAGAQKPRAGLGNTGVGSLGEGGGSIFRGGGGLGMKDGAADTGLTDAIKKLLNPDGTEKKTDARNLASSEQGNPGDSESFALPADVSIFQQVTAKYHQLNTNGAI